MTETTTPELPTEKPVEASTSAKKATRARVSRKKKIAPSTEPAPIELAEQAPAIDARPMRPEITASLEAIYKDSTGAVPDLSQFKIKKTHTLRFFGLLALAAIVVGGISLFGWMLIRGAGSDNGENVLLTLAAPSTISLGTPTTLTATFRNNEKVAVRSAVLELYYPEGFVPQETSLAPTNAGKTEWQIGTIPPQQEKSITVTGVLYAPLTSAGVFRGVLSYRPENFTSSFEKNSRIAVTVTASPISMTLAGPGSIKAGSPVSYTATITKGPSFVTGGTLALRPITDASFHITSSTLPVDKNNRLLLPSRLFSTSSATATIIFSGLWGDDGESSASFGIDTLFTPPSSTNSFVVATASTTAPLVKNEVRVSLAINGTTHGSSVHPGSPLSITIEIANNGASELKKGTIRLQADGPAAGRASALDWSNLVDEHNGTVIGTALSTGLRRGTITWTASDVPALTKIQPGETAFIDIKLPIKDGKSFDWGGFSSTSFILKASGDFVDSSGAAVHVEDDPLALSVVTDVALEVRDSTNQDTPLVHTITWILTNDVHPLKDIQFSATVFGDAVFTPPTTTPAGTLTYDKKTKTIIWRIPTMPADTDVFALPFTLTLGKTDPTQTTLVSKVTGRATDEANGSSLTILGEPIILTP